MSKNKKSSISKVIEMPSYFFLFIFFYNFVMFFWKCQCFITISVFFSASTAVYSQLRIM